MAHDRELDKLSTEDRRLLSRLESSRVPEARWINRPDPGARARTAVGRYGAVAGVFVVVGLLAVGATDPSLSPQARSLPQPAAALGSFQDEIGAGSVLPIAPADETAAGRRGDGRPAGYFPDQFTVRAPDEVGEPAPTF